MSIEVKGLGELAKKLAKLGGTDTAISNGTREAARIVNNSAKELCPVDNGNLRASLHTDYKREGSKHIGSVLTNVEYAAMWNSVRVLKVTAHILMSSRGGSITRRTSGAAKSLVSAGE